MGQNLAMGELTQRLRAYARGDRSVEERLVEDVYPVLRRHARRLLARDPGAALVPTELANEAYLRIFRGQTIDWRDSMHFRAIAALTLRRILAGMARDRQRQKRGGGALTLSLDHLELTPVTKSAGDEEDLLAVEAALQGLAEVDPSAARVVELRFFGGLNMDEVALCSGLSVATAGRRWRFARAWLRRRLSADAGS